MSKVSTQSAARVSPPSPAEVTRPRAVSVAAPKASASWGERLSGLARELAALRTGRADGGAAHTPVAFKQGILVDAEPDRRWAHADPRFDQVVHVFAQEWFGIRSAAAYLPGRKLAVTIERPLWPVEKSAVLAAFREDRPSHVVVHTYGENLAVIARLLRRKLGARVFGVWHGSSAQFHLDHELRAFGSMLDLRHDGTLDGLACVKPGMHLLSDQIHRNVLLNYPPKLPAPPAGRDLRGAALVPLPVDWRKNFHTNVYAAAAEPRCRTIYVTSRSTRLRQVPLPRQVVELRHLDRPSLFEILRTIDISLNATLSECQPMVALESLAFRVPCLTGPLALGELDRHPYQRLAQVAGVDTLTELRAAVSRLLDLRERSVEELSQMMDDYERLLLAEGADRLGEFLGL